jgi:beta-glucosidase
MTTSLDSSPAPAPEPQSVGTRFPTGFLWGVATSAYQIEGAAFEDGRTASIWDTFSRVPGATFGGHTGDVACDHYHRMPEDVDLIAGLGVDSYRFSLSWPRIQPGGKGAANQRGIAFYDRLVDRLLERGVLPWVTLYHWDLPQELEDAGGWPARDTAYRFADYAEIAMNALGDRVTWWTTLNEPWCSAVLGYETGRHAPGRQDFGDSMAAVHHLLLGHGLAAKRLRETAPGPIQVGVTLNTAHAVPATDTPADRAAARRADGFGTRVYTDPLVLGSYPVDVVDELTARGVQLPVQDGDLSAIAQPLDFLGVNYYTSHYFSGTDELGREQVDGEPVMRQILQGLPVTAMDWEITPDGFTDLLVRLGRDYPGVPLYVTENGAAFDDEVGPDGAVDDADRTAYFDRHLDAVADAREAGADIRGYFAWSLMDNFEWGYGYDKRFGIVHVDYETQARTVKQSGHWFADTIRSNRDTQSG